MNEEIRNILKEVTDGEKVLKYVEDLEEQIEELEEEIAELEDDVNDLEKESEHHHHHHDENCDCGCHDHDEDEEWKEVKTPYTSTLTVKSWEELLKSNIFTKDSLILMKRMRHIAAPTSPMELADMFGYGAMYYKTEAEKLEQRLAEKLKLVDLDKNYYWSIIFDCWKNKHTEEQIAALKPELYEALGNIDLSDVKLRENEV